MRSPFQRFFLRNISRRKLSQQPFWLASLMITALLVGSERLGWFEPLELMAFDRMTRLQRDRGPDDRLLIVEITEKDLQAQEQWPMSDERLATVLQNLQAHNPSAIGLDIYRNLKHPPGTTALAAELRQPNVIGIRYLADLGDNQIPPPAAMAPEQVGFNDFVKDPDAVVRRQFAFASLDDENLYAFSLRLALKYLSDRETTETPLSFGVDGDHLTIGETRLRSIQNHTGGYRTIDAAGYQYLLRYRSENRVAASVSLTDVINGDIDPALVKGKIVLLGATAPSLKDNKQTPYRANAMEELFWVPGVHIHAQMTSQLLDAVLEGRPLLEGWPGSAELLWVWSWSLLGGLLAWYLKHPFSLALSSIISLSGLMALSILLFSQALWVPVGLPIVAFVFTSGAMVTYRGFYATLRDPVTGLPTRELFKRQVARALQRHQASQDGCLAVLFIDIDRFQTINETFGHPVGDQFLQAIARKLGNHPYRVARLDKDAFGLLLRPINHSQSATDFADKLQQELSDPITLNGTEISTTASVGISLAQEGYRYDPEQLIQDAHTATYRAKSLGKARYEVFSNGLRSQAAQRFQVETDLKLALQRGELFLTYQPLVDLTTGAIAGFEALVRWQHPERGIVSPGEFIPIAEETGLIIPMGQWIFAEACRQSQAWRSQFPRLKTENLIMSINLSAQQFNQPDLFEQMAAILEETQLPGNSIKLELTESMVMDNVEATIPLLLRFKSLEIKLGLDDFGTGYSSLSYLHRFPLDTLKIDRSFVMQMEEASENKEIVKTIVSLGHNLGMDIIAEGVETQNQAEVLKQLYCEYGQGYFFAKPLMVAAATAVLAENKRWGFLEAQSLEAQSLDIQPLEA